jgi:acetyl-CoA carboxylase biotin carboxyl carrier protein
MLQGGECFMSMVISPLAGTFYKAPAPDEAPFVEIGQKVGKGDVVCIVESMKVFMEIRSEVSGIVKNILVEDEDAVLKGQDLIELA